MAKRYGKIWTVSSTDDTMRDPVEHFVAGAYADYDQAVDAMVDYIMERLECNSGLAYGFAHDENHEEINDAVSLADDGATTFPKGKDEVRGYIKEMLVCEGCYYIYDGEDEYHFDIDECDLVFHDDVAAKAWYDGLNV